MTRTRTDAGCGPRSRQRLLWLSVTLAVAGCASQSAAPGADRPATQSETRAKPDVRVELDGLDGFTVSEVVRIDSDVRADYQRAVVLLRQGRVEEGIDVLESVTERAPDVTIPHIDLGVAYGQIGAHEKALRSLEAALALAPEHPAALNELGIAYRRLGRFGEARASYERVLAIHPRYHYALLNLGVLCDLYLEDLDCALGNYQAYAEMAPEDSQVGIWISDLQNRLQAER